MFPSLSVGLVKDLSFGVSKARGIGDNSPQVQASLYPTVELAGHGPALTPWICSARR